ncbi:MAG: type II secretion system F family protein [Lentisphaeria bacterium]|nr:type II secretion system F family protein [Lentisphaeria bacterium]
MMDFINTNIVLLASASAGCCVFFSAYIIIDFMLFTGNRYKERFIQEAAVEMDDVLLQIPPGKILDVSLAGSAISAFIVVGLLCLTSTDPSWSKIIFLALVAVMITFPLPRLYLRHLRKQRLQKFSDQLEDALLAMSSSLKAGFSINQAMESVAQENRSPISFEFKLLTNEIRLGVPLEDALENMNKRMQSPDFELVSVAIITARQTGGELTGVLERLAGVIRERVRIQQKIRSLTAQGRMQAWIIGLVPFGLMLALFYIAPDMMDSFFSNFIGILLLIGVILLDICGFLMIRKITTIDI